MTIEEKVRQLFRQMIAPGPGGTVSEGDPLHAFTEKFELGLFDDKRYVDLDEAERILHCARPSQSSWTSTSSVRPSSLRSRKAPRRRLARLPSWPTLVPRRVPLIRHAQGRGPGPTDKRRFPRLPAEGEGIVVYEEKRRLPCTRQGSRRFTSASDQARPRIARYFLISALVEPSAEYSGVSSEVSIPSNWSAICLPSSTPHWSNALMPQMTD